MLKFKRLNSVQMNSVFEENSLNNQSTIASNYIANELKTGDLKMSMLMNHLYNEVKVIDKENVSIHSAFICMLHLANEHGLNFVAES